MGQVEVSQVLLEVGHRVAARVEVSQVYLEIGYIAAPGIEGFYTLYCFCYELDRLEEDIL